MDKLQEAALKILLDESVSSSYTVSHEKSKFGNGYRSKVTRQGKVVYLGGQAYSTPKAAEEAAEYYMELLNSGLHTRRIDAKMMDYYQKHGKK